MFLKIAFDTNIKTSMKKVFLLLLHCLFVFHLSGQNLEKHKWENRILIIKTMDETNPMYKDQFRIFKNSSADFKERKLVLYQVVGNRYKQTSWQDSEQNGLWKDLEAARDIPSDFEIVLIGLDGGVKLKQTTLLDEEKLYQLIDGMPMRRAEQRRKEKRKGEY